MSEVTGRALRLTRGRKLVTDFLHFSSPAHTQVAEREANLATLAVARQAAQPKLGWFAVLLKASALACVAVPELRLSRFTFPFPRLYQHRESTAFVTMERELDGESAVLGYLLRRPETKTLLELQTELDHARTAPLHDVKPFRRALKQLRFSLPVRRALMWLSLRVRSRWCEHYMGTFTISSVASGGGALTRALCPHTAFFAPAPISSTGAMTLRLFFDDRVIDAARAQAALAAYDAALRGPVLDELRALATPLREAV